MIPPALVPRLVFAGKAFVLVALLAAAAVLVVRAQEHRRGAPRHLVDLASWRVAERPGWATDRDVRQLRDSTGLVGHALPLYDRSAADLVRRRIEAAPAVRRVLSMRRVPPDRIAVELEMRRPVAAVPAPGGRWVEVDAEGVVLAPAAARRPERDGVPLRIVTGAAEAPPAPGATCAPDVLVGLELCRLLDGYRDGLGRHLLRLFDEVDVTNLDGRSSPAESPIVLRASVPAAGRPRATPCVVEWGGADTRHGEPPFDAKAGRLERAIALFGDFEGVARVRVAFASLIVLPVDGPEGAWLPALGEQTLGR